MADLQSILDSSQIPKGAKADAWDAFQQAQTQEQFKAKFDSLMLPNETKAALWDLKFGQGQGTVSAPGMSPQQAANFAKTQDILTQRREAMKDPGFWKTLVTGLGSMGGAITANPAQATVPMMLSGIEQALKARQAFREGHPLQGAAYGLTSILPAVGPMISETGEAIGERKYGQAGANALMLFGPQALHAPPGEALLRYVGSKGPPLRGGLSGLYKGVSEIPAVGKVAKVPEAIYRGYKAASEPTGAGYLGPLEGTVQRPETLPPPPAQPAIRAGITPGQPYELRAPSAPEPPLTPPPEAIAPPEAPPVPPEQPPVTVPPAPEPPPPPAAPEPPPTGAAPPLTPPPGAPPAGPETTPAAPKGAITLSPVNHPDYADLGYLANAAFEKDTTIAKYLAGKMSPEEWLAKSPEEQNALMGEINEALGKKYEPVHGAKRGKRASRTSERLIQDIGNRMREFRQQPPGGGSGGGGLVPPPGYTGAGGLTPPPGAPEAGIIGGGGETQESRPTVAGGPGGELPQASAAPSRQTRPEGTPELQGVVNDYNAQNGLPPVDHSQYHPLDEGFGRRVADAYDRLQEDNSADPQVRASYDALIRETKAQWDHLVKAGYKLEPWTQEGQPYANSHEMVADVKNNKHLYFYQGGEPHPFLSAIDPDTGLSYNDMFRAVHDAWAHAAGGFGFGPRGEEMAHDMHSQSFSPLARQAMTTETRGQNSWVNFGKHNYDAEGNALHVPATVKPFATQKVDLLQPEFQVRAGERYKPPEPPAPPAMPPAGGAPGGGGLTPPPGYTGGGGAVAAPPTGQGLLDRVMDFLRDPEGASPSRRGTPMGLAELMGSAQKVFGGEQAPRTLTLKPTGDAGKLLTSDLGQALENSVSKRYQLGAEATPEQKMSRAIESMSNDLRYAVAEDDGGSGWYTNDVAKMEEILKRAKPQFNDPAKMSLFKYLLGIVSNGVDPDVNFDAGLRGWDMYERDGRFSAYDAQRPSEFNDKGTGLTFRANSYEGAMDRFSQLVKDKGEAGASEWLQTKHPVSELKQYYPKVKGKATDMRYGSYIFGEKVGAFGANLNGIHTELTADKWWSRSWNRWMGTLMDRDSAGNLRTNDEGDIMLQDAPRNQTERNLMREAAARVAGDMGLTVSELQAVFWYAEQRLYRTLGIEGATSISYADAAQARLGNVQPPANAVRSGPLAGGRPTPKP
jgi:hypothetical protein